MITPQEALSRLRADPYDPEAPRLKKVLGDDYFQQAQAAEKEGKKGMAMVAFRRAWTAVARCAEIGASLERSGG